MPDRPEQAEESACRGRRQTGLNEFWKSESTPACFLTKTVKNQGDKPVPEPNTAKFRCFKKALGSGIDRLSMALTVTAARQSRNGSSSATAYHLTGTRQRTADFSTRRTP
jgi:hypothetical protein